MNDAIDQLYKDFPLTLDKYAGGTGPGWATIIRKALEKFDLLFRMTGIVIKVGTIKEKFGTLRMYTFVDYASSPLTDSDKNIINDIVNEIESMTEHASEFICEETGEPGTLVCKGGWFKTLSEAKAKELGCVPAPKGDEF